MKYILAILTFYVLIPQLVLADPSGMPTAAEIARYKDLTRNHVDIIMYREGEPHTEELEKRWKEMQELEKKIKAAAKPNPAATTAQKPPVGATAPTTPKNVQDAMQRAQRTPHNIDFNPPAEMPFPKNSATIEQQIAQVDALAAARASAARTNLARNNRSFGRGTFLLMILHGITSTIQGGFLTYSEIADRVAGYRRILADSQLLTEAREAAARGDHRPMEARNRISAELIRLEAEKRAMEERERERMRSMTQRQIEDELIDAEWARRNGI